jgi:hypothetical protein
MANGSSLNRHNDQQLLDCVFGRDDDAKLKFLRPGDHLSQQLVYSIGMNAGTLRKNVVRNSGRTRSRKRVAASAFASLESSEEFRRKSRHSLAGQVHAKCSLFLRSVLPRCGGAGDAST